MAGVDDIELAYLAGFFDGEGCIGIKHCGRRHHLHKPYATVSQVKPEVLSLFKARFGGGIHFSKTGGKHGIWCWQAAGVQNCLAFLTTMEPYLRQKRAEARIIIEAFAEMTVVKKAGVPAHLIARRDTAMRLVQGMR